MAEVELLAQPVLSQPTGGETSVLKQYLTNVSPDADISCSHRIRMELVLFTSNQHN